MAGDIDFVTLGMFIIGKASSVLSLSRLSLGERARYHAIANVFRSTFFLDTDSDPQTTSIHQRTQPSSRNSMSSAEREHTRQ